MKHIRLLVILFIVISASMALSVETFAQSARPGEPASARLQAQTPAPAQTSSHLSPPPPPPAPPPPPVPPPPTVTPASVLGKPNTIGQPAKAKFAVPAHGSSGGRFNPTQGPAGRRSANSAGQATSTSNQGVQPAYAYYGLEWYYHLLDSTGLGDTGISYNQSWIYIDTADNIPAADGIMFVWVGAYSSGDGAFVQLGYFKDGQGNMGLFAEAGDPLTEVLFARLVRMGQLMKVTGIGPATPR